MSSCRTGTIGIGPSDKRVYVLTRSAFAGQQRYAAGAWSGDINAEWDVYARQIDVTATADKVVTYDGSAVVVNAP